MYILDLFLKNPESTKESFPWLTEDMYNYIRQNYKDKECELEVFLSYSHKDKKIAALTKNLLQILGLKAFMAHDDIKPTTEWFYFAPIIRDYYLIFYITALSHNFLEIK